MKQPPLRPLLCNTLEILLTSPSQPDTLSSKWSGFRAAAGRFPGWWWLGAGFVSTPSPPGATGPAACWEWHLEQEAALSLITTSVRRRAAQSFWLAVEGQSLKYVVRIIWAKQNRQKSYWCMTMEEHVPFCNNILWTLCMVRNTEQCWQRQVMTTAKKGNLHTSSSLKLGQIIVSSAHSQCHDLIWRTMWIYLEPPASGQVIKTAIMEHQFSLQQWWRSECGAELSQAGLSLAINSMEQFPALTTLAGVHRGTCRRGRGVGRLLPGYRLTEQSRAYAHALSGSSAAWGTVFSLLTIYSEDQCGFKVSKCLRDKRLQPF